MAIFRIIVARFSRYDLFLIKKEISFALSFPSLLQSSIRICFHERRLQYTEREQMLAWQRARPGERLLQVDVPLSYGMLDVSQVSPSKNSVEFMWDPTKEVGVYIKVYKLARSLCWPRSLLLLYNIIIIIIIWEMNACYR